MRKAVAKNENGDVVQTFESVNDAAQFFNMKHTLLLYYIKRGIQINGLYVDYLEERSPIKKKKTYIPKKCHFEEKEVELDREKYLIIKYEVKDKVVEYLTPFIAEYQTKADAEKGIGERLRKVEEIAKQVLSKKGFSYGAKASIERESFPLRVYEEFTLPAGEYTALIIRLGSGKGDNWWCVVYPPLCFSTTTNNVVYKSKIQEIIRSFKK